MVRMAVLRPKALTELAWVARVSGDEGRASERVATKLANSGLAAFETSAMLGHSSPSFTMSVYQHTDLQSVERTRTALEGAFGR